MSYRSDDNNTPSPASEPFMDYVQRIETMREESGYEARRAAHAARIAEIMTRSAAADADMPQLVKNIVEGEWKNTPAYTSMRKAVGKALRGGKHFIIAVGPTGTGKTVAACKLALELVVSPKVGASRARFVTAIELGGSIDGDEIRDLTSRCCRAGVLVLDDLGQESKGRDRIVRVLTSRHNSANLTFITTNTNPEKFHQIYDQRISDRLIERGITVWCRTVERPGVAKKKGE